VFEFVVIEQVSADDVRRSAAHVAHAEVDVRLAEVDGQQLAVTIGVVQDAHIAEGGQFVEVAGSLGGLYAPIGLGDVGTGVAAGEVDARGAGDGQHLQKFSARDGHFMSPKNG
jgi:hypothetical protein